MIFIILIIMNNSPNTSYVPFKIRYDLNERKQKHKKASSQPLLNDKILIIMEPHPKYSTSLFNNYFSCEADKNILYLVSQLRRKMKGKSTDNLFLYIDNSMLMGNCDVIKPIKLLEIFTSNTKMKMDSSIFIILRWMFIDEY